MSDSNNPNETKPSGRVVVSVVLENELIEALDAKAKTEDMNRSQLLRRMIRRDLLEVAKHPEPVAA